MKRLEFLPGVWKGLMGDLHQRGGGRRESGAFLLGRVTEDAKVVSEWVSYEDLDPASRKHTIIRLDTSAFPRLWQVCADRDVQVVADIHTHPGKPIQSRSDRAFPMLALSGHIALIAPRFARGMVKPADVSFNVYAGGGQWKSYFGADAALFIKS
jgi:proteasome lid subunit RPN8/RPN11